MIHPPKNRTRSPSIRPEDDPKKLQRRITELENQVSLQQRLIVILREMPLSREAMLIRDQVVRETQGGVPPLNEKNAKPARKARVLRKS